jgi:hypothetical protein
MHCPSILIRVSELLPETKIDGFRFLVVVRSSSGMFITTVRPSTAERIESGNRFSSSLTMSRRRRCLFFLLARSLSLDLLFVVHVNPLCQSSSLRLIV